ncbi:MAG: hypothetical protein IJR60_01895 [Eubacterium sp.]|nr:hypothetical protein [Eubacterium sp.]
MIKRYISLILGAISTAYTVWYMHYGVPYQNSGALSKIGLEHRGAFWVWGVLTYATLAIGLALSYRRYTKTKAYIPLLAVSGAGMLLTLMFDFEYRKMPDYYLHCAGSLAFSAVTGGAVLILFILTYKKAKMFCAFTWITGIILASDLICLLIFKETGLIEALPVFAGYLMLGLTNLRRDKVEIKR